MMKKIQVLGTGCPKCQELTKNAELAVGQLGIECEIEKVTDLKEIMKFGVMMTPALAIDGEVKVAGKVVDADSIVKFLQMDES